MKNSALNTKNQWLKAAYFILFLSIFANNTLSSMEKGSKGKEIDDAEESIQKSAESLGTPDATIEFTPNHQQASSSSSSSSRSQSVTPELEDYSITQSTENLGRNSSRSQSVKRKRITQKQTLRAQTSSSATSSNSLRHPGHASLLGTTSTASRMPSTDVEKLYKHALSASVPTALKIQALSKHPNITPDVQLKIGVLLAESWVGNNKTLIELLRDSNEMTFRALLVALKTNPIQENRQIFIKLSELAPEAVRRTIREIQLQQQEQIWQLVQQLPKVPNNNMANGVHLPIPQASSSSRGQSVIHSLAGNSYAQSATTPPQGSSNSSKRRKTVQKQTSSTHVSCNSSSSSNSHSLATQRRRLRHPDPYIMFWIRLSFLKDLSHNKFVQTEIAKLQRAANSSNKTVLIEFLRDTLDVDLIIIVAQLARNPTAENMQVIQQLHGIDPETISTITSEINSFSALLQQKNAQGPRIFSGNLVATIVLEFPDVASALVPYQQRQEISRLAQLLPTPPNNNLVQGVRLSIPQAPGYFGGSSYSSR